MTHLRFPSFLLLAAALAGCGDNQSPGEAQALWDYLQAADYRTFARAPGFEVRQPSNTAHSDAVDIYVNDVVEEALLAGEPLAAWPPASLIVKDGFNDDGELDLIAAMEKRDDGWFWVEWTDPVGSPGSEAKFSGQPSICTDCHSRGEDFVRAFRLPR